LLSRADRAIIRRGCPRGLEILEAGIQLIDSLFQILTQLAQLYGAHVLVGCHSILGVRAGAMAVHPAHHYHHDDGADKDNQQQWEQCLHFA
jgi:hypothetical protein